MQPLRCHRRHRERPFAPRHRELDATGSSLRSVRRPVVITDNLAPDHRTAEPSESNRANGEMIHHLRDNPVYRARDAFGRGGRRPQRCLENSGSGP